MRPVRFAWIDERPFNYLDDGRLVGCDVALARRAVEGLGEPFEPLRTTFGELLPGLAEGRWEVTTGMFVTAERQALAPFTEPIWSLSDGLLVAEEEIRIAGYRDLARLGVRVAVLRGQVQHGHPSADPADWVSVDDPGPQPGGRATSFGFHRRARERAGC